MTELEMTDLTVREGYDRARDDRLGGEGGLRA